MLALLVAAVETVEVNNWPSAVVMVVILLGPGILAWLSSRRTGAKVEQVAESLSSANGGSSVRDALNRIEAGQEIIKADLGSLTRRVDQLELPKDG